MKLTPIGPLLSLILGGAPAWADFKASASFMTDAVYRGYSKSRNNPAFAGNLEYEHGSGIYGGLWGQAIMPGPACFVALGRRVG